MKRLVLIIAVAELLFDGMFRFTALATQRAECSVARSAGLVHLPQRRHAYTSLCRLNGRVVN